MAKVASDNMICLCFSGTKRRLPTAECHIFEAMRTLRRVPLKIRYGNTAPIVVRDGSADYMAKGGSLSLNTVVRKGARCTNEKSVSRIEVWNSFQTIDRWRAGYAERCTSGSGGGVTETAGVNWYGAVIPTS
jgi:hypothetical protein